MSSYTVELVGGQADGKVICVPDEVIKAGTLNMAELGAEPIFADPDKAMSDVAIRKVCYRITGAVNARGCLRAVIERE